MVWWIGLIRCVEGWFRLLGLVTWVGMLGIGTRQRSALDFNHERTAAFLGSSRDTTSCPKI